MRAATTGGAFLLNDEMHHHLQSPLDGGGDGDGRLASVTEDADGAP